MSKKANFHIHGQLRDFVKGRNIIEYAYAGRPSIKDAIEAIGPPHPEVGKVTINGKDAILSDNLDTSSDVEIMPRSYKVDDFDPAPAFVLDVHLGKLAKMLRMLGFDTLYQNDFEDKEIALLADEQKRIVLTRDVGLLKNNLIDRGYWLRSQDSENQLKEVLGFFNIKSFIASFTRCMKCNGLIAEVNKQDVIDELPLKIKEEYNQFYQCFRCGQVYWKGSHYEKMEEKIKKIS